MNKTSATSKVITPATTLADFEAAYLAARVEYHATGSSKAAALSGRIDAAAERAGLWLDCITLDHTARGL